MWLQYLYFCKRENKSYRHNNGNRRNKKLTFKNNAPFRSYISKISNTFIDKAEDLGKVKLMYDLFEYSDSYAMTSEIVWNYHRDGVNDDVNENNDI